MSKQKKGGIIKNFRLTLVDDDTHDKVWSKKFTRIGALVTAVTVIVVTIATIFCVIAFTPIRTLIPGYPDARSKHDAIKNAITIDSLENVLTKWELYSENLRRVVDGQEPLKIDSLMEVRKNPAAEAGDSRELAEKDSLLRKEVADEDRFDIKPGSARTLPIEGMHFFTPLKGVVSQGYDKALHPYIDITAPGNSVVMSVLDGTVISAGWNDTEGYTIRIQHEGDIISVYKHNQKLLKETGDKVTAGTPIAVLGGTGSTSDGDHLHFELWHKGEAVDPTKYISF
ncbi:MAG: M23 family metallopeptidase [Bacteroidales bacterium]|uniref:M23 family metallopeptidase n=1 Tax=Candidatus Cryptobacteroides bacterium TaxID=3085639 RepID=UPI000341054E|nr:M23 family metallopeptidase [Bacteroidales bacterium]MCI6046377.1 M23 family metallopeptidase [Alistipes sp.]MDY4725452.1 M23 family metallopeptidase [Candidatus Cryptobacteroides sp.]MDY5198590.1 M23 family metallopeptidase [Candidatus Cryptobacteroides sp.]CCX52654.1 membrane peptidase [Alistipes sp. CAG:514]